MQRKQRKNERRGQNENNNNNASNLKRYRKRDLEGEIGKQKEREG